MILIPNFFDQYSKPSNCHFTFDDQIYLKKMKLNFMSLSHSYLNMSLGTFSRDTISSELCSSSSSFDAPGRQVRFVLCSYPGDFCYINVYPQNKNGKYAFSYLRSQ